MRRIFAEADEGNAGVICLLHASGTSFDPLDFLMSPRYAQRAGHDVRLLVVMRFIRLHPGAQKGNAANYWSLFEPHYKQNLSANPKRTAKSSLPISDASDLIFVQIIFHLP